MYPPLFSSLILIHPCFPVSFFFKKKGLSVCPSVSQPVGRTLAKTWIFNLLFFLSFFFSPRFNQKKGNCLCAKFHQKIESYSRIKITNNVTDFLKATNDHNFVDYIRLSPSAAITIQDGIIIKNHTNLPQLSARVYSHSKYIMWNTFFSIATRLSQFGDNGGIRLMVHDTDSCFISFERQRSEIEMTEIQSMKDNQLTAPYEDTFHGHRFSNMYLKAMGHMLDYSSLNEDSIIHKNFLSKSKSLDINESQQNLATLRQLQVLSTFGNEPFKIKDESFNQPIKHIYCASASKF